MKRFKNVQFLLIGVVIGAVMFGGTVAYAAGILAQPKTAAVVIDGKVVDLKGYVIEGSHYFQLRDLDAVLSASGKDFSIVWDGANNRVLIDTSKRYDPNEQLPTTQTTTPTEKPTQTPETPDMSIEEMKAEIVRLTNLERVKAGLPELKVLPELTNTAQAKADDMIANHYYGHTSPVYGTPGAMIKAAIPSAKACAENLASWTKTPQKVVDGLMASPEHRTNMMNPKYTHIGVGIAEGANGGYWWVQQFVTL